MGLLYGNVGLLYGNVGLLYGNVGLLYGNVGLLQHNTMFLFVWFALFTCFFCFCFFAFFFLDFCYHLFFQYEQNVHIYCSKILNQLILSTYFKTYRGPCQRSNIPLVVCDTCLRRKVPLKSFFAA